MSKAIQCRLESYLTTDRATRQKQVLAALRSGPKTARQVMAFLGYSDLNTVRPRLTELAEAGRVVEAGTVWDGWSKRRVTIYKLAESEDRA